MTDLEIKAGFLSLEPRHPFFQALLALLDNEVDLETAAAIAPDLADGARHFNAGRLANAKNIRTVIEGLMTDAISEAAAKAERQKKQREAQSSDG